VVFIIHLDYLVEINLSNRIEYKEKTLVAAKRQIRIAQLIDRFDYSTASSLIVSENELFLNYNEMFVEIGKKI